MRKKVWFANDIKPEDGKMVLIYRKWLGDNIGRYDSKSDSVIEHTHIFTDCWKRLIPMNKITKWKYLDLKDNEVKG